MCPLKSIPDVKRISEIQGMDILQSFKRLQDAKPSTTSVSMAALISSLEAHSPSAGGHSPPGNQNERLSPHKAQSTISFHNTYLCPICKGPEV